MPAVAGVVRTAAYSFCSASMHNKALPRPCGWQRLVMAMLLLLTLSLSGLASAAHFIASPPAQLNWDGAAAAAKANVTVIRFERMAFYRYDPDNGMPLTVWQGNFANIDSLSGTPSALGPLPAPQDAFGNPLPLNTTLPLSKADFFEALEPLFIVAESPLLPASGFATRPDGRRIIAVTVDVTGAGSHTIALTETAIGSDVYVGYLQPNVAGSVIDVPPSSTVTIRYDNNGDISDSQTSGQVDPLILAAVQAERRTGISSNALPSSGLFLSKSALRSSVSSGDFLAYELQLENTTSSTANNVTVTDTLPAGFRYQSGSLRVDGISVADPLIDPTGSQLSIPVNSLAAGATSIIRYVTEVTATARGGRAINRARANAGPQVSNLASAEVLVERAFYDDRAFLVGRVIGGQCGEQDAPGIAGIRIYMEDGTSVITDDSGRWHIEGVTPGTHVLQLDTLTLGPRHELRQCHDNTRQAGNPRSRFVNVQGGTLWRENWYIDVKPGLNAHIQQQLTTTVQADEAIITLRINTGETRFDRITSQLMLPDTLTPIAGSALLDGKPISDPVLRDQQYEFNFTSSGYFRQHELQLRLKLDPETRDNIEKSILFNSFATTPGGRRFAVSSLNRVKVEGIKLNDNELVLRPRFPSMSAQLSERDKQTILTAIEPLRSLPGVRLQVAGHTDSQRIIPRAGRVINDNYALSLVRAQAVADSLAEILGIEPDTITVLGKGADQPIADNNTAEGRALNRRVTVTFFVPEKVADAQMSATLADSGIDRDRDSDNDDKKDGADAKLGFTNITDDMVFVNSAASVTARLDSRLTPKLVLNGKDVDNGRIGSRISDKESNTTVYTWIGLELDRVGEHEFELQGTGSFNIVRFRESVKVRRSARIKTIRIASAATTQENVADGLTPLQLRLELLDEFDQPIKAQAELKILSGTLRPLNHSQTSRPLEDRGDVLIVDRDGLVCFDSVSTAGTYRLRLTDGNIISDELDVPVSPDLREWILVGFAEGTVGYNTLRGNMRELGGPDNHAYSNGEAAFFARGTVKGEWLLTAAYDSRPRDKDQPYGQAIDPQRWYSLYGDDTQRSHDAASREKLYVRMEKRDFYALFGDYDTDLTVTELSRYQRTLTGAKVEWRGRNAAAQGFIAESPQGFMRDDIPADGTSGLYRLSRTSIIPGSETVSIEVRDRFTNEVISTRPMTRFIDYSLDSNDGTLYFRQPVSVQDSSFNPQRIVATYEVDNGLEKIVVGGRVSVYDEQQKLTVGVTAVEDNTLATRGALVGTDITWKPNQQHTVKAELAGTHQSMAANNSNEAWLAEHVYTSEKIDTRIRAEQTDSGFGLGQMAADDDDSRLLQAGARYRFNEDVAVSAESQRQEVPGTGNRRDLLESRLEYQQPNWQAYAGGRYVEDQTAAGVFESRQLIAGGRRDLMDKRLSLSVVGETSVDSSAESSDYPKRLMLGSDYRLNKKVSLFANQEFTWGYNRNTQDTRVGARANPWQGGTATTEVNRSMDEYGPRLMAHAGLFQAIELSNQWSADVGFDRAQTITDSNITAAPLDPRRPSSSGTAANDYTAVAGGLGYRDAAWQWTNRAEYRHADTDDKWNLLSGFSHRLDDTDTLAGRALYFHQDFINGDLSTSSEVELSYARRPLSESWFWLNRTRVVYDELSDMNGSMYGHRLINNTLVNFVAQERHQLSLQYGARYVGDTIDSQRYRGYSDLIGGEYRYDITERWDIGLRGSTLASYNSHIRHNAIGVMAGFSPIRDVWISLGYNFRGFYDDDFSGAEGRVQGIVLDFRIKFDQHSVARRDNGELQP